MVTLSRYHDSAGCGRESSKPAVESLVQRVEGRDAGAHHDDSCFHGCPGEWLGVEPYQGQRTREVLWFLVHQVWLTSVVLDGKKTQHGCLVCGSYAGTTRGQPYQHSSFLVNVPQCRMTYLQNAETEHD